ncbi:class I SAM-dependent methyltransferase [Microbacterium gorillae]|uniref:class I SAM-dependent methyltransferase n=1 Tax=Microbacterium gorillae TaxID=1231063 RepID=UPI00058BC87A|nr:methyltransferase domain-containing protein [Microbacterium gorillae]
MDDLLRWLTRLHDESTMTGWDFGKLDGRLDADDPPWDFDAEVRAALRDATEAVDVGTGGGERLIAHLVAVGDDRGRVRATEGWPENVPVARANLASHGIEVLAYDPEAGERFPLPDASVDLLIARHEAVDAPEFARVLRPGGRLLTQQVDGRDAQELREWFGGESLYPEVELGAMTADLAAAGFVIDAADDWTGRIRFRDVGTLVEYIAMVPWDVPDFSIAEAADQLHRLAEIRPIEVTQRRFRITATQP